MRLATFNAENLFGRYNFKKNFKPTKKNGFTINDIAFDKYDKMDESLTAQAVKEVDADVIALQEIESLPVLDRFNSEYLSGKKYLHRMLIDSFDPRQIDVAILSRYPIVSVRSRRQERTASNKAPLFSRDCLEAVIDVEGKLLVLYVNHFKSMMEGRKKTRTRRLGQTERVAEIIDQRWKQTGYDGNFAVLGDFNDYYEGQADKETALKPLLEHLGLVNIVDRLPEDQRWTHFYAGGKEYRQLDYILLSKSLAAKNPGQPGIMRKGLPVRADKYKGPRFKGVGQDNPKSSDHAPLFIDIEID